MVSRVLICCRGEIAHRFIRTCQLLGLETVVIYSADDDQAPFVLAADATVRVAAWDPATLIPTVIGAALDHGADAVAPGYGPLAENAQFAEACVAAGLVFIGPNAAAVRQTGDKIAARAAAQRARVPLVPGRSIDADLEAGARAAAEIGYPVLLKAALGGGGRGIRVVSQAADFAGALAEVRHEALRAFGSDQVYLEKFLGETVRHIEVQVVADQHGHYLHLGTRECSVQRRRQKIVEEAPAPNLSDDLRQRLHEAALAMAREVAYDSVGTVEFLVDANEQFYFIEMNARIQVEHPVTEAITGVDIVEQLIRSAQGLPLALSQKQVQFHGHALEFRLCAESAHGDFLPTGGRVVDYRVPEGPGIRVDSGIRIGSLMSPLFDSLCLKLIVSAGNRAFAVQRARAALDELLVAGFSSNLPVHAWLLAWPPFVEGRYDLSICNHFPSAHALPAEEAQLLQAVAALARHLQPAAAPAPAAGNPISTWTQRNSHWQLS
ncbi:acetyl/propionyl/methylcrotonyl-CoA carboxylase subunit alpha [Pseudomonas japonica]|uniref:acetyl-CoA carboxylase biotin carboxylase subunit n=1 Tax=Pseudomonas japonica TaxID=256466 RepID=UPI0037F6A627